MCNIAGYVGTLPAAPILIDMLRREEGWDAGFYTGIATLHEGTIAHAKVTGDLDHLLQHTSAASLPGTAGIMHSRTNSGGDTEWGHPFLGGKNGEMTAAYVANGSQGMFKNRVEEAGKIAAFLEQSGYLFRSRVPIPMKGYPSLPGGGSAHMSDVMAQLAASKIDAGSDAASAMIDAFCQMPAEIVGLLLSVQEPGSIAWSRVNMPMFVAFAPHGAYLASTPQAFPQDAGEPVLLPACSGGRVCQDHFTAAPYKAPPARVAPVHAQLLSAAYALIEQELKANKRTMPELVRHIAPLFSGSDCDQKNAVVYQVLFALEQEGRLITETVTRPGAREDLTAPLLMAHLK